MKAEVWKKIKEFSGYEVSSFGRVRSYWARHGAVVVLSQSSKLLKQRTSRCGYQFVFLKPDTERVTTKGTHKRLVTIPVHRLVMEAFVGPRPNGYDIAHNDGKSKHNHVENLRYATRKENMSDAERHGTKVMGETVGTHKLTTKKVIAIKREYNSGKTSCEKLARKFGVHHVSIVNIITGKTWKHVPVDGPMLRRRGNAQLTEEKVLEIQRLYKTTLLLSSEIAQAVGASVANVNLIGAGKAWTHIIDNTVTTVYRRRGHRPKPLSEWKPPRRQPNAPHPNHNLGEKTCQS